MYINKLERITIKIALILLLIGGIVEGIRYMKGGNNGELKHVKAIPLQR
jgi:hypothetical protein